jgi:hypothetical protein
MWISSRLHYFDKKLFEINFLKKLCINTNLFSTTSKNSVRNDKTSINDDKKEVENEGAECLL